MNTTLPVMCRGGGGPVCRPGTDRRTWKDPGRGRGRGEYLGGQVFYQSHHGVLEERASRQGALGHFRDVLLPVRPHSPQGGVRAVDTDHIASRPGGQPSPQLCHWKALWPWCQTSGRQPIRQVSDPSVRRPPRPRAPTHLLYISRLKSWKRWSLFLSMKPSTEYLWGQGW